MTCKAEKMILIPEWQYNKMLESYDKVVQELKELKKVLEESIDFQKNL